MKPTNKGMTSLEKQSIAGLSAIFGFRMLGLFMIFPVFTLNAGQYEHATPMLIGFAIGAYGLTQALLQIPFGMLSDRIGRKRVITFGLLLFAAGSIVAALADNIYLVIAGRLLQGSGAIAAAIMALTADLTRDEHRTKAMASIGISIGISFSIALAAGASLAHWIGLSGIFWFTAALALVGIAILHLWVPAPIHASRHRDLKPVPQQIGQVLRHPDMRRLVVSILVLHLLLTLSFFALPIALQDLAGLTKEHHGFAYLPVLLLALVCMIPFIIIAEKHRKMKPIFIAAVAMLAIAQLGWALLPTSLASLLFFLWLFFTAFNILEASLPSMMSKLSPLANKGTAMGVYSSAQFIGAFLGGVLGGGLYTLWGPIGIFAFGTLLTLVWALFLLPMQPLIHLSSRILSLPKLTTDNANDIASQLLAITGIKDVIIVVDEKVAYLKYQPEELDEIRLDTLIII